MLKGQLADASLNEVLKGFVLLHIDLTKPAEGSSEAVAADKFGVRSIPDLRILAPDGTERKKVQARQAALARRVQMNLRLLQYYR